MSASREVKPKTGDPIQGEAYIHWAQLGNMRMDVSASDTGAVMLYVQTATLSTSIKLTAAAARALAAELLLAADAGAPAQAEAADLAAVSARLQQQGLM